jgi:polyisoprenyl-teichoic acid--peptidoglycan teichoic acid transferase
MASGSGRVAGVPRHRGGRHSASRHPTPEGPSRSSRIRYSGPPIPGAPPTNGSPSGDGSDHAAIHPAATIHSWTYGAEADDPVDPSSTAAGRRRRQDPGARHFRARSLGGALGLTTLGTFVPGTGFLAAGRRRLGWVVLAIAGVFLGAAVWLGLTQRRELLHVAVNPNQLRLIAGGLLLMLVAWVAVVVTTHRMIRPTGLSGAQRFFSSAFVALLCLLVATPFAVGARYAYVQSDLIDTIFGSEESATTPTITGDDPWGDDDRVNVMLLGGDGGVDREGIRTDSVIVASIDTETGNTVLFSLPRNLEEVPFPKDSPLHDAYPDGFTGEDGDQEFMLNAIYRNVPAQHPGILGTSDNEGADALKLGVSGALGITVDYYVLVNLAGFEQLVDAMGGVTVNINEPIPIGGNSDLNVPPEDYLDPGAEQHLDGFEALWYSRGRYGLDDYNRMERQRCMIDAIIDEANPTNLLRRYTSIASATKEILRTDIPQEVLDDFVDLALEIKDGKVRSVVFKYTYDLDSSDPNFFNPGDPDYKWMHRTVAKAIGEAPGDGDKKKHKKKNPADEAEDACAYNPV